MLQLSPSRLAAVLALGALAVHELRYRLGFDGAAEEMLDAHGHGYLRVAGALVAGLAALALGREIARWASGRSAPVTVRRPIRVLWPALALGLAVTFSLQELLEGWLASGHPSGIAAVTAGGGWTAFAASGAVAYGLVLSVRLVTWASELPRPARPVLSPGGGLLSGGWRPARPAVAVCSAASARGPPLPG